MKRAALLGAAAATTSVADAKWFKGGSRNREREWEPAKATVSSSHVAAGSLGWTPKPTPGPAEDILRHELLKRAGTSTCGYFTETTSPSAAIVCLGSSQCIVNDSNKAMGCCSSSNIQACNIATVCVDSTDATSISTSTLPYTLLCQASTAPSCVTYSYATDSPYSGFRAFACGSKKELFTVAYTAPGAPSTNITSAAGATTTTAQNSLPSAGGGGNAPPITITSSSSRESQTSPSANTTSAGSPTTTTDGAGAGASATSPVPTNENNNNSTSTILAGVIGGVGGLVIILAGLLSAIFYARKKKKDKDSRNRKPVEKVKRPYMPAAFPNSFDYIANYREARMSRRQSGRPLSGFATRRQSFVRSFRRRSSMLPFWRQSQHPQNQQQRNQQPPQQQYEFQRQPSLREHALPRRSSDRKIVNSARFPLTPMPRPLPAARNIRQEEFDFGTGARPSPTISVPVNRNARGMGPAPATPTSTLGRRPITHLESGSTSTLARQNSMSFQTPPHHRAGGTTGTAGAATAERAGVRFSDEAPSAHTDFDSRFTPPFISPPAGLRHQSSNENIGIATVLSAGPAGGGGGAGAGAAGGGRIVSTTGATTGSMSKHNSRALTSPRSPRAQQYLLYNPKYGRPREEPVKRPVGHLNKIQ